MRLRLYHLFANAIAVLSVCGSAAADPDALVCRSSPTQISVSTSDRTLAKMTCHAVSEGIEVIEACGLVQSDPVKIEVGDGPVGDYRNCLGLYDCESDDVYILAPEAMSKLVPEDSPLAAIPVERLFYSIVTHELAHAFHFQMRGGSGETNAEDEYVAYAMQYLSLSEADRLSLLEAMPGQATHVRHDMLNDLFLTMSPVVFGSWVWRHFEKQEDRCGFIAVIVAGEVDFTIDAASMCQDPPECTIKR